MVEGEPVVEPMVVEVVLEVYRRAILSRLLDSSLTKCHRTIAGHPPIMGEAGTLFNVLNHVYSRLNGSRPSSATFYASSIATPNGNANDVFVHIQMGETLSILVGSEVQYITGTHEVTVPLPSFSHLQDPQLSAWLASTEFLRKRSRSTFLLVT